MNKSRGFLNYLLSANYTGILASFRRLRLLVSPYGKKGIDHTETLTVPVALCRSTVLILLAGEQMVCKPKIPSRRQKDWADGRTTPTASSLNSSVYRSRVVIIIGLPIV